MCQFKNDLRFKNVSQKFGMYSKLILEMIVVPVYMFVWSCVSLHDQ